MLEPITIFFGQDMPETTDDVVDATKVEHETYERRRRSSIDYEVLDPEAEENHEDTYMPHDAYDSAWDVPWMG